MRRAGRHTFAQTMRVRAHSGKNMAASKRRASCDRSERLLEAFKGIGDINRIYDQMPYCESSLLRGRIENGEPLSGRNIKALRRAFEQLRGFAPPAEFLKLIQG